MRLNSGKPPSVLRRPPSSTDCPLSYPPHSSPAVLVVSPFFFILHTSQEKREKRGRGKIPLALFPQQPPPPTRSGTEKQLQSRLRPDYHFIWQTDRERKAKRRKSTSASLPSPKRIGCRLSSLFSLVVPLHPTPSPSPLLSSISIPFYELRSFVRSLGCPSICSLVHFQNASSHFLCPLPLLFRSHCV